MENMRSTWVCLTDVKVQNAFDIPGRILIIRLRDCVPRQEDAARGQRPKQAAETLILRMPDLESKQQRCIDLVPFSHILA